MPQKRQRTYEGSSTAAHEEKTLRRKSKSTLQCTPGKDRSGAEAFGRKPVNWLHLLHDRAAVQCSCERVCLHHPLSAATHYSSGYHSGRVIWCCFLCVDHAGLDYLLALPLCFLVNYLVVSAGSDCLLDLPTTWYLI